MENFANTGKWSDEWCLLGRPFARWMEYPELRDKRLYNFKWNLRSGVLTLEVTFDVFDLFTLVGDSIDPELEFSIFGFEVFEEMEQLDSVGLELSTLSVFSLFSCG